MAGHSTSILPWKRDFLEFFDLAQPGWTMPTVLRRILSPKRVAMTVEAVFTKQDGQRVKLIAKLRRDAAGIWWVLEERLEARFVWKPEAVSHEP